MKKLNLSSINKRLKLSICVEDETPTNIRKYLQIYSIHTGTDLRIFFARMSNINKVEQLFLRTCRDKVSLACVSLNESLGCYVPWTMRPFDDASLAWHGASLGRRIPYPGVPTLESIEIFVVTQLYINVMYCMPGCASTVLPNLSQH